MYTIARILRKRAGQFSRHVILRALMCAVVTLLLGFLAVPPAGAAGASFTVTTTDDLPDVVLGDGWCGAPVSGPCTLRAAIQEANATPAGDTITLPAGLYRLTITGPDEDNGRTGDLDITRDLTINGADENSTIIDGNSSAFPGATTNDRVIDLMNVSGYVKVQISRVTIQHGDHAEYESTGGGIRVRPPVTLTVADSIVTHNTLTYIQGQSSYDGYGGGIANYGTLHLINTTVKNNTNRSTGPETRGYGGGIYNQGTLTITNSTISQNSVGGWGYHAGGGGIYNDLRGTGTTLVNSTVSGNSTTRGGPGGGIYNAGGSVTLISSTISGNTASGDGGGVANNSASTVLKHTIIAGNTASTGAECSGWITSQGHNLIKTLAGCTFKQSPGDVTGKDPRLGPLQDNGGPTFTHGLLTGSPAVGRGDPQGCTDASGALLPTDQRGYRRPIDGNGDRKLVCDIGAIESGAMP